MAGENISFKWNRSPAQIAEGIVAPDVKLFAAATWHKLYTPFVPMRDGYLSNTTNYLTEGSMGVVHHTQPYSHYQYVGTGFRFRRNKHPLASAHWDQAAIAAGKATALAQSIQTYIGGRSTLK